MQEIKVIMLGEPYVFVFQSPNNPRRIAWNGEKIMQSRFEQSIDRTRVKQFRVAVME
jgi:hypothetical protein